MEKPADITDFHACLFLHMFKLNIFHELQLFKFTSFKFLGTELHKMLVAALSDNDSTVAARLNGFD